jgi:hypothetical protein
MAFPKFQTKEVLNKVLNSGEDALKVDIDNVTLNTESSTVSLEVDLDHGTDDVLIYANTNKSGSGTSYVPLVDSDGHLQVDTMSSALPSGAATAANQATIISSLDALDNAVDGNYLNVNANIAGTDFVGGAGAVAAGVQRVTLASDDPAVTDLAAMEVLLTGIDADTNAIKTAVEIIDNAIDGSQMQVDVVAISAQSDGTYIGDIKFGESLPAGSNAIGKLAANSGVDIGDVDVTSMPTNSATISNQTRSATSYAALTGSNLTTDNQGIFSYVIQITSTDNCTLKVQGSNDNSNWVDDDMDEVTIATGASGLISGTSFFKYIRLQFKSSATNGTTVNGQGFAK